MVMVKREEKKVGERDRLGVLVDMYTVLYLKYTTNKSYCIALETLPNIL